MLAYSTGEPDHIDSPQAVRAGSKRMPRKNVLENRLRKQAVIHLEYRIRIAVPKVPDIGRITIGSGSFVQYDYLIVASGATHSYFGNETWESDAPGLKSIENAIEIRRRIMLAFEDAERNAWDTCITETVNFTIIGGGPTGVELAGAIRDISTFILKHEYRFIDPAACKVLLLEGSPRILAHYPDELSRKAEGQLYGS